ncbi:MAG: glycosyltransferase [Nanoarchaeota archaeon]|nr:glycosyltransferase [Nanoarchaeota archaeon]
MENKVLVSIILPTYNESKSIIVVIKKIKQIFKKLTSYKLEIIIVDDNSGDKTGYLVQKEYKYDNLVKVFIRKAERGLGTAIGYGINKAQGSIIIGMDADGNHPVSILPIFLKELKTNDLVIASRFVRGGGVEEITDRIRHLGSFMFNLILKILGFPVWDNTSGFYGISKKKLISLKPKNIYFGYGDYHLRLVYFAKLKNFKIKEIPCVYGKRIAGESKSELFKMFFDYLKEGLRLKFK